jgi:hypothetical protein
MGADRRRGGFTPPFDPPADVTPPSWRLNAGWKAALHPKSGRLRLRTGDFSGIVKAAKNRMDLTICRSKAVILCKIALNST